jgi:hypothetical protein
LNWLQVLWGSFVFPPKPAELKALRRARRRLMGLAAWIVQGRILIVERMLFANRWWE